MSGSLLRAGATAVTLAAVVASALFVGGHLRNPAAPLRPPVPPAAAGRGVLHLTPSVRSADVTGVTSTYAS